MTPCQPSFAQRLFTDGRPRPLSLVALYCALIALPYLAGRQSAYVATRNPYAEAVTLLTLGGMAMLLLQFMLSGRIDPVSRITGVDEGLRWHRKVGEILALLFVLHPLLIHAPRFLISGPFAFAELWSMFSQPLVRTGLYAWGLLIVMVLVSMFRERSGLSYEAWRISHGLVAVAIAILATDHALSVGRHGAYDAWFNTMWIAACSVAVGTLIYSYLFRPLARRRRPFQVVSCEAAGRSDWLLTIEQAASFPFPFKAGQFAWLNIGGSPFSLFEHPFSIASAPAQLPQVQFLIRALGDFTGQLGPGIVGQRVYLDGPHGEFTLRDSGASGLVLIAGGAGIGPILGLLRQLDAAGETRPVRLIYGNQSLDQMVLKDEIAGYAQRLDFIQTLAVMDPPAGFCGHHGVIDRALLEQVVPAGSRQDWDHFLCGPPRMVTAVAGHLKALGVPPQRTIYEQLAF